jgi:tetratricopeptide (TPR) repeat protein
MMKPQSFGLAVLFLVGLLSSGCDSGQYGESVTTKPKSESALSVTTEPPAMGEQSTMEGALLAISGTSGAKENDEGVSHFQQEHWDVAQEHFTKALAINPDLPEGQYNLALTLDKLGNHGEATNHFKMALNLAPEDPRIKDSGILKSHVGG